MFLTDLSIIDCAEKETIVSPSSSAYPKQHMFLLLNPRDEDDFTKTHLEVSLLSPNPLESFDLYSLFFSIQQVLKLYSKELPDMNYASNTRKQSAFLERCVSKGYYILQLSTLKTKCYKFI